MRGHLPLGWVGLPHLVSLKLEKYKLKNFSATLPKFQMLVAACSGSPQMEE